MSTKHFCVAGGALYFALNANMSMPATYRLGSRTLYTPQEMAEWQDELEARALGAVRETVLNQIKHIFLRQIKGNLGFRVCVWRSNTTALIRQRGDTLSSDKRSLQEQNAVLEKEKKTLQKVGRSVRKEADELNKHNRSLKVICALARTACGLVDPYPGCF